jgi:putative ABC transport system ATP-binding protein
VSSDSLLSATGLAVSYGATTALHSATIEVAAGELVAVMGASGSGKSTLLHCLAGLVRPDMGSVRFDGDDLFAGDDAGRSDIRLQRMGMVFQFGELVPELTLAENVALPLWLLERDRKAAAGRASELLDRFDIADQADKRPGEVSGGQLQRAAVARALVHRPSVVFADEPTGALDSANAQIVMESLVSLAREQEAAVVLVTHESRLASYCDRDVVVKDGYAGSSRNDDSVVDVEAVGK